MLGPANRMRRSPDTLKSSLIACSLPGAIIALVATLGAAFAWGGLSFGNPTYYLTLAVAAWCPVSKLVIWRSWRREVETCLVCRPENSIRRRLSPATTAGVAPPPTSKSSRSNE